MSSSKLNAGKIPLIPESVMKKLPIDHLYFRTDELTDEIERSYNDALNDLLPKNGEQDHWSIYHIHASMAKIDNMFTMLNTQQAFNLDPVPGQDIKKFEENLSVIRKHLASKWWTMQRALQKPGWGDVMVDRLKSILRNEKLDKITGSKAVRLTQYAMGRCAAEGLQNLQSLDPTLLVRDLGDPCEVFKLTLNWLYADKFKNAYVNKKDQFTLMRAFLYTQGVAYVHEMVKLVLHPEKVLFHRPKTFPTETFPPRHAGPNIFYELLTKNAYFGVAKHNYDLFYFHPDFYERRDNLERLWKEAFWMNEVEAGRLKFGPLDVPDRFQILQPDQTNPVCFTNGDVKLAPAASAYSSAYLIQKTNSGNPVMVTAGMLTSDGGMDVATASGDPVANGFWAEDCGGYATS